MTKFKVGDKVRRTPGSNPSFKAALGTAEYYTISAVSSKGYWVAVNGWDDYGRDLFPWSVQNFELYTEQDDPLPPAPESVRYYHRGYYGIHADAYLDVHSGRFASGPRIRINDKNNRGITIDADTALQLAHDLTRMAMEIKRKEKQPERKTTLSPAITHPYGE